MAHISIYKDAQGTCIIYHYPDFSPGKLVAHMQCIWRNIFLPGTHLLHLGRERQLWIKCLVQGHMHRVGSEPTTLWLQVESTNYYTTVARGQRRDGKKKRDGKAQRGKRRQIKVDEWIKAKQEEGDILFKSQKGINAFHWCFVEKLKGAFTKDFVQW